jgi:hypothetical protein
MAQHICLLKPATQFADRGTQLFRCLLQSVEQRFSHIHGIAAAEGIAHVVYFYRSDGNGAVSVHVWGSQTDRGFDHDEMQGRDSEFGLNALAPPAANCA